MQAGLAAFDIHEFFRAEICAETGFGDDVVRQFQSALCRDDRVATVSNVCKWTTVDKRGIVLNRLHKIGREGILQQRGHRSGRFEVRSANVFAVARLPDNDVAQPALQIVDIFGQAKHRHDLGRGDDVPTVFARKSVAHASQRDRNLPQRSIVHVDGSAP